MAHASMNVKWVDVSLPVCRFPVPKAEQKRLALSTPTTSGLDGAGHPPVRVEHRFAVPAA